MGRLEVWGQACLCDTVVAGDGVEAKVDERGQEWISSPVSCACSSVYFQ